MRKTIVFYVTVMIVFVLSGSQIPALFGLPIKCFASGSPQGEYEKVSIGDLVAGSAKFDGKKITITGEVIGDLMRRKDGVWVNVLEDGVAMGVFMSQDTGEKIRFFGKYGYKGDLVQIRGIFNHACPFHSGEPDIHCESLVVLEYGQKTSTPVVMERVYLAVGSLLLSGILFGFVRKKGKT